VAGWGWVTAAGWG